MFSSRAGVRVLFFGGCLLVLDLAVSHELAQSQDKVRDNPFSDKFLTALFNPQIQKELEIVGDQQTDLKQILESIKKTQTDLGNELKQYAEGATKSEIDSKREDLVKQFARAKEKAEKSALNVLLPHQQNRLSQLTAQMMLRESAKTQTTGFLAPEMIQWLEIDQQQQERLRTRAKEIRDRLTKRIQQLNEEAKAELLQELSPKQREKYNKLVGEPVGKR